MADLEEGRRPTISSTTVPPLPDLIPSGTSDRSSSSTMASLASLRGVDASSTAAWHHHAAAAPLPSLKVVTDSADSFDTPFAHRPEPVRAFAEPSAASSLADPSLAPGSSAQLPRAVGNLDSDSLAKLQQAANYANLAVRSNAATESTAPAVRQRQLSGQGSGWESGDEVPNLSSSSQASSGESDHILTPDSALMAYRLEVPAMTGSSVDFTSPRGTAMTPGDSSSGGVAPSLPVAGDALSDRLNNLDTRGDKPTVERNPTLRARPQHLSRLPSHTTDVTARPSPPSTASSAAQTPAAAQPSDPMAALLASGTVVASASASSSQGSLAASQLSSPNLEARPPSSSSNFNFDASRDSWRSLLPEEDSLYPAADDSRSVKANHASSVSGMSIASSDAGSAHSVFVADSRRFSGESQASFQSAFSMPGQSLVSPRLKAGGSAGTDWAATESWRSLLPENDAAYASSRNASLPGPSPSVVPPLTATSSTTAAATAAAKRHASFSAYDGRSDLRMSSATSSQKRMSAAASRSPATVLQPSGRLSSFFSSRPAPSTPPSMSEGVMSRSPGRVASILSAESLKYDDDDRESWPCSRASTALSAASGSSSGGEGGNGSRPGTATSTGTASSPIISTTLPTAMSSMGSFMSASDLSRSLASRPSSLSGADLDSSAVSSSAASKGTPTPRSRAGEDAATVSRASRPSPSFSVSPGSVSSLPFLESRPAPPETSFHIRTEPHRFLIQARLPGFSLEYITLATKNRVVLQIVADKWDDQGGGHFEKRVLFSAGADLRSTSASFDGKTLTVTVPRRPMREGDDEQQQEPYVVLNTSPAQAAVPSFGVGVGVGVGVGAPSAPPSAAASATSV